MKALIFGNKLAMNELNPILYWLSFKKFDSARGMSDPIATSITIRAYNSHDLADCKAVTEIYAHHVAHGTASFEVTPPSEEEIQRRFTTLIEKGFPILLACNSDGQVLGYAYCGTYKERAAYNNTVEDSIYVRHDITGKGVGIALLTALIKSAKSHGYLQMMAVIGDSDNRASIRLHAKAGFRMIGTATNIGFKFNRFLDVVYMQLDLTSPES